MLDPYETTPLIPSSTSKSPTYTSTSISSSARPTSPQTTPSNHAVETAALLVVEALRDFPTTPLQVRSYSLPSSPSPVRRYLYSLISSLDFRGKGIPFLLAVSMFERPIWMRNVEDLEDYPSFSGLHLEVSVSRNIELFMLGVLLGEFLVKSYYLTEPGRWFDVCSTFWSREARVNKSNFAYLVNLVVLLVCNRWKGGWGESWSPFLRLTFFIISSRSSLRSFHKLLKLFPEILRILLLQAIIICLYAWFACVIFSNNTAEGRENFEDFKSSVWSLWILVTTANYPDIQNNTYGDNRVSCVYFISFLIICYFFMTNLLLGAVYNNYQAESEMEEKEINSRREANMIESFNLLDSDNQGVIDLKTVETLFTTLNTQHTSVGFISPERAELLFAILDGNGDHVVDEEEYVDFCKVLSIEFMEEESFRGWLEILNPKLWNGPFFSFVRSTRFEYLIDALLVLNAVLIGFQSEHELAGDKLSGKTYFSGRIGNDLELVFTLVYFFEVVFKILGFGWKRYWESNRNRFDFLITAATVGMNVLILLPNGIDDRRWLRFASLLRLLRLLRLVIALEQFRMIGEAVNEILPVVGKVGRVLLCTFYLFSCLGVEIFGGLITTDTSSPYYAALKDTDYFVNNYFPNNFNDFLSSFVTLFELMVVNNWIVICDGFTAVTSEYARFYFVAFHVVGVCVVNNLVVSVILDCFMAEFEHRKERKNMGRSSFTEEEGVRIEENTAVFDATSITGTSTKVTGKWRARISGRGIGGRRKSSFLRTVFTHRGGKGGLGGGIGIGNGDLDLGGLGEVEEDDDEEEDEEEGDVNFDTEEPPRSSVKLRSPSNSLETPGGSDFYLRSPSNSLNSLDGLNLAELAVKRRRTGRRK
ncbi:hypothetical protein TL16_g10804 [Triparma laevis f. inornata]|uniref:EF-hand domain-containing protein n=1 Tax=Triparma laevis f. inornata TaxID=1714386 RepID=A0A9W7EQ01_9STRA|nr:hypothetical protein TL16_g10804 [Triparma laevis f. inornata]